MKKVLLVAFLLISAFSIYAKKVAMYSIPLSRVEILNSDDPSAEQVKLLSSDSDGLVRAAYEDSLMQIIWKCDGKRFKFDLLNKTSFPLTIDWNNIVYVDTDGLAGKVIHNGIKYVDRNQEQLKTIVPRLAKTTDFLVPSNNCVFQSGGYFSYAGWSENYLFPCVYKNNKSLKAEAPNLIGKVMRIDFPIMIGDKEYNYAFYFELTDLLNEVK